MNEIVVEH